MTGPSVLLKVTVTLGMFWQRQSHETWLQFYLQSTHVVASQYLQKTKISREFS